MAAIEVLSLSCRNSLNGENLSKFQCFRSQFCASWWSCKRPLGSQVKRHQVRLLKANLKCRQIADNRQGKGDLNLYSTLHCHCFLDLQMLGEFFWPECIILNDEKNINGQNILKPPANKRQRPFRGCKHAWFLWLRLFACFIYSKSIKYWLFARFEGIDKLIACLLGCQVGSGFV